jgi:hypothetical protein
MTEVFQYGLEEFNKEFAKTKDASKASKAFFDGITSDEGLESYAKGFAGGAGASAAGSAVVNAVDKMRSNKAITSDESVDLLIKDQQTNGFVTELIDASVKLGEITPEQAEALLAEMNAMEGAAAKVPAEFSDKVPQLAPIVLEKQGIDEQIAAKEIEKAQVDESFAPAIDAQIEALNQQKEALNERIQQIISPTETATNQEAGIATGEDAGGVGVAGEGVQAAGVQAASPTIAKIDPSVSEYDGMFSTSRTGTPKLDGLLEDDGYEFFYKGTSGEIVMMSPDEYLAKVRKDITKADKDAGILDDKKARILEGVEKGDKINMPFLSLRSDGTAFEQEGRNRAVVARERGETSIPVFIEREVTFDDKVDKGREYVGFAISQGANSKDAVISALRESGLHRDGVRFIADNFEEFYSEQLNQNINEKASTQKPLLEGVRDGGQQEQGRQESAQLRAQEEVTPQTETEVTDANEITSPAEVPVGEQPESGQGVREQDTKEQAAAEEKEVTKEERKAKREAKAKEIAEKKAKAKEKADAAMAKIKDIINKPLGIAFDYNQQLKDDKAFFNAIRDIIVANIELGSANFSQIVEDISNAIGQKLSPEGRAATKAIFNREVLKAYRQTYNALSKAEQKKADTIISGVRKGMINDIKLMLNPRKWEEKANKIGRAKIDKDARAMLGQIAKSIDGLDLSSLDDAGLQSLHDAIESVYETGRINQKDMVGLMKKAEKIKGAEMAEIVAKKKKTIKENGTFEAAENVLRAGGVVKVGGRYYTKSDLKDFQELFDGVPDGFTLIPRASTTQQAKSLGKGRVFGAFFNTLDLKTLTYMLMSTQATKDWVNRNINDRVSDAYKDKIEHRRKLTIAFNQKRKEVFGSMRKANKKLQEVAGFQPKTHDGRPASKNATNNLLIQLYNSVRQPDGYEKALNLMPAEQIAEAVRYVMSDPQLIAYANALVDMYKVYKPQINAALEAAGYASERLEDKPYPTREQYEKKFGKEKADAYFDLLEEIYGGQIPATIPYSPISTESLDPEHAVPYDILNTGTRGEMISIISNNLLLRKPSATLELVDPDSLFSNYVTSMTNMVNKLPLLGNFNAIFSKENMREIQAQYGASFATNLKDQVNDVLLGKTGKQSTNNAHRFISRELNRANAVTMFVNTRSALFQLVSIPNFALDAMDSGVFYEYVKAVFSGGGKEFREGIGELSSEEWVRERFEQSASSIELQELKDPDADKYQRFIDDVLNKGYALTQTTDVAAILIGGTPFYVAIRNSEYKANLAAGMNEQDAMDKAREKASKETFRVSQESQQSSLEYQKSAEQKNPITRTFLAFATTNQQYSRKILQAAMDIKNGRGSVQKNLFTIAYYAGIQNLLFNLMSKGATLMFGMLGGEDEDEREAQATKWKVMNQSLNGLLRGFGAIGGIVAATKDALYDMATRGNMPDEIYDLLVVDGAEPRVKGGGEIVIDAINNATPPLGIKVRQFKSFIDKMGYAEEPEDYVRASAAGVQAATNIPTARLVSIYDQFNDAITEDLTTLERIMRITNVMDRYTMQNR